MIGILKIHFWTFSDNGGEMDFIFTINPPQLEPQPDDDDDDAEDNESAKTPRVEIDQKIDIDIESSDLIDKLNMNAERRKADEFAAIKSDTKTPKSFDKTSPKSFEKTSKSFDEVSSESSVVHFDVFDDDDASLTSFENDGFDFSCFYRPSSSSIPFHRSVSMPFNRTSMGSEPQSLQVPML